MEALDGIVNGFAIIVQPSNLLYCFWGCLIGTMVGVLPGIGVAAAFALLLPATLHIPPVGAIIMLAGIYYGAQYGGSTTSILVNIPGEATSVMTCVDGHQMALQGRAGAALGISAIGSFFAGTVGVIILMFLAPILIEFAIKFGPPEMFSLMLLGLTLLVFLTSASMIRSLMMAAFGFLLGTVGLDKINGTSRFCFGIPELMDGLGLVSVVMGLFGISEVLLNVEQAVKREILATKIKGIFPTKKDWLRSTPAILRGTGIGFPLGVLPGGGAVIASFVAYAVEKMFSKHPEQFGKGAIEGVAAPESANNAAAQGAFVPILTLGVPSNVPGALLLGALIMYGVSPGPTLIYQHPDIFWGIIASMYVGNIMLLILNLPLIGLWVQLMKVPYSFLFPLIVIFCVVGAFSINNSIIDVYLSLTFGVIGYVMKKLYLDAAPLVMAFVLGPMMETALRQSLIKSDGSFSVFFSRPISATFIILAIILLVFGMLPRIRRHRPGSLTKEDLQN